jgi:hypothetical protein
MLCDTDASCVAITLALCWEEKRNSHWNKEWYKQRPQNTRANIKTDVSFGEPH